ncbi:hypothetical protein PDESU_00486 [Pontiella desulfatans]|uniref:Uncharacterized protein n=1 Tax=Pontiella desulfatans TaxID=2750659 RepID=A0A6C2TWA0_PONDE|nr:hypothetical protein [Pontiella desulfatans]VGO11938.1 hypothetical protein PDESU_00486 [Pontiella desulfatans]
MKNARRRRVRLAVPSLLLLIAGCGTISPPISENPYLGYVRCKAILDDASQKADYHAFSKQIESYQEQIASSELKSRMVVKPAEGIKKLDQWQNYVNELERVIVVQEDQWMGAASVLKQKELMALRDFWSRSQDKLSFEGAKASTPWERELTESGLFLTNLKKESENARLRLDSYRQKRDYFKALDEIPALMAYGDIGSLKEIVLEEATVHWVGLVREWLVDCKRREPEAQEPELFKIYTTINSFKVKSGMPKRFDAVMDDTIDTLGNNWRQRITELGENRAYWEAYQLAREKVGVVKEQYASRRADLVKAIGVGYRIVLDQAMKHYLDRANSKYSEDFFGISHVYGCMALEMIDFCKEAGIEPNTQAKSWSKNIADLMVDVEKRVGEFLSRRLVIYDFESDERKLGRELRLLAAQSFERSGNAYAWAVTVPGGKTLDEESLPPPVPGETDYVVSGEVSDYSVEQKDPVYTPVKPLERGTERIAHKPNPNYGIKGLDFSEHQTIHEQAVDIYPCKEVERQKRVSVDLKVSCDHGGERAMELFALTKDFVNDDLEAVIWAKGKEYGDPSESSQPRLNPNRDLLTVDTFPSDNRKELAKDSAIYEEVDLLILGGLMGRLEKLLGRYPLQLMKGNPGSSLDERCDRLGLVLVYCGKLSEGDLQNDRDFKWIHRKKQIESNIEMWNAKRWPAEDSVVKKELAKIFKTAIDLRVELDKQ